MFRTLIQLWLLVLLVAITAVAQSSTKISGTVIMTNTNGDFVHPTFSPDGKVLAYAKVLATDDFENSEVVLHELGTNRQRVLLSPGKAAKYATYKAAVTGMKWPSATRLEVQVSDGDVGSAYLTFNPLSRRLLKERFEDLDEIGYEQPPLSPVKQKAFQQVRSLFPSDSAPVFNDATAFRSDTILAVSRAQKAHLYLYRDGKVSQLGEFDAQGFYGLEVKYVSPSRIIFLLRSHPPYERGDNPLFVFDGRKLLRIKEHAELHDAGIDPRGQRIAYCYWSGEKRHLVVRQLDDRLR